MQYHGRPRGSEQNMEKKGTGTGTGSGQPGRKRDEAEGYKMRLRECALEGFVGPCLVSFSSTFTLLFSLLRTPLRLLLFSSLFSFVTSFSLFLSITRFDLLSTPRLSCLRACLATDHRLSPSSLVPLTMTSQHGLLRKLNFLLLPLLSSSLVSLVYAQNHASTLLPAASGSFPSCAVDCSRLHQAETNCVASTGSETTNQKDAVSCFCASGLLSQLHHSPNGTCDDTCADTSDRQLLQTWFANYCSSGDENVRRNTNAASEGSLDSNPSTFTTHKLMARDGSPTWYAAFSFLFPPTRKPPVNK